MHHCLTDKNIIQGRIFSQIIDKKQQLTQLWKRCNIHNNYKRKKYIVFITVPISYEVISIVVVKAIYRFFSALSSDMSCVWPIFVVMRFITPLWQQRSLDLYFTCFHIYQFFLCACMLVYVNVS